MMEKLIERMRTQFRDPSLPFLFVQLAPFGHWLGCGNEGYSIIRGCQQKVSRSVPHAAMASIMDIGSRDDIHPKFKRKSDGAWRSWQKNMSTVWTVFLQTHRTPVRKIRVPAVLKPARSNPVPAFLKPARSRVRTARTWCFDLIMPAPVCIRMKPRKKDSLFFRMVPG